MHEIYKLHKPERPLPIVFDSPHSGSFYPDDFSYACDLEALRKSEDHFIDDLFSAAPSHGATLLCALFARSYVDLNRAEDDLDPLLFEAGSLSSNFTPTRRSEHGLGLIHRIADRDKKIYDRYLSLSEINLRIERYYRPYHSALKQNIDTLYAQYKTVCHINCHAMPSDCAHSRAISGYSSNGLQGIDFTIGNRDGNTCSADLTREIRDFLKDLGYNVSINDPFKGAEIIRKYGDPLRGTNSLQLEINKALYMDEENGSPNKNYKSFKQDIEKLIVFLTYCIKKSL